MSLTVGELKSEIDKVVPTYSVRTLNSLEYIESLSLDPNLDGLRDVNSGQEFAFDDEVFENFARFLHVPAKFAGKLPSGLRKSVIDHFMKSDETVVMTHFGNEFRNMYEQRTVLLPPQQVVERIARVFDDTAVVSKLDFCDGIVANVRTSQVNLEVRPGDITEGGIRFNALHGVTPTVSAYMERLVCSNGMVATSDIDSVPMRGFTLNEILESMQSIADHYLSTSLPTYLENWQRMTEIQAGNAEQLIHRLARENDLSTKLESRMIESAALLEDNNYYNIINLITSFQHVDGVDESQIRKIQRLGGNAVRDLGGHRCHGCSHLLEV